MITITEVIRRSDQGVTRPFICRADDGFLYYVKGSNAGYGTNIREWICGNIAKMFCLPVPDFEIASVERQIIDGSVRDDIYGLGVGEWFSSKAVEKSSEIVYTDIEKINVEIRQKIFFFDKWVGNYDRTLSTNSGNPNMLIDWTGQPIVIDHNLAFDFNGNNNHSAHIFYRSSLGATNLLKTSLVATMRSAIDSVSLWWSKMPDAWTEITTDITQERVVSFLSRNIEDNSFWSET